MRPAAAQTAKPYVSHLGIQSGLYRPGCYDDDSTYSEKRMKFTGFLLLVSGAMIVLAALALLNGSAQLAFIAAGVAIELGGLTAAAMAHRPRPI